MLVCVLEAGEMSGGTETSKRLRAPVWGQPTSSWSSLFICDHIIKPDCSLFVTVKKCPIVSPSGIKGVFLLRGQHISRPFLLSLAVTTSMALITTGAISSSFLQSIQRLLGLFPFLYGPPSLDGGTSMPKAVVGRKRQFRQSEEKRKRWGNNRHDKVNRRLNGHRARNGTGLISQTGKNKLHQISREAERGWRRQLCMGVPERTHKWEPLS